MTHLNALELNLSHERARLANAKTDAERASRSVWVAQLEREIASERKFFAVELSLTDDELMAELQSGSA